MKPPSKDNESTKYLKSNYLYISSSYTVDALSSWVAIFNISLFYTTLKLHMKTERLHVSF